MNIIKRLWLAFVHLVGQICSLPDSVRKSVKERQKQTVSNALEVERLDRIRNPSKYLGK